MKSNSSLAAARSRRFTVLQKLSFAVLASGALLAARSARAQTAYTDAGATGLFSTAITPTITADTSYLNGDSLTFNNTATSTQTDDLTTALNFNVLTFSNTAALTLSQGAGTTLTLGSTTGGTAPTVNLNNTGTIANGLNIVLANNTTFSGAGSATFSGVVSGGGSLTNTGAGTLTLSGTNTYSGGTFVTGGILAVTSDANLGSTAAANLVTLNGGALQGGTGSASVTISANHGVVIGANGGTLTTNGGDNGNGIVFNTANTLSGSGNLTLTGNNGSNNNTILVGAAQNITGNIFVEDRIQLTSAAATLGTGAITIGGGTAIGTGTAFGSSTTGQIFVTQGSGTVTLANAINLNGNGADNRGAFRVGGPALVLNGNITLQSNSYLSGTGTNTITLNGTTTGAFTLNLGNSFAGGGDSSSSASYVLNGADSASATYIGNGSLVLGTATAAQGTMLTGGSGGTVKFATGIGTFFAGSLAGNEAIGLADTGGTAVTLSVGSSQTYSGTLTGGAGSALTYTGTGEAHFQATATSFAGAVNANETGGGKLDTNVSLGSGGSYNVASGSTLFVFGGTLANTIFNLSGGGNGENLGALRLDGGNIDATSTINLLTDTSIGGNGGTATIAGVIAGTHGFNKAGGDTLILSGANTFSGATGLGGGTLNLSNALALQNSTLNYTGGALVFDASVTGNAFTFGGLSGGASIALLNNAATPSAISLTAGGNNADTTYSGVLSGTGSNFTKVGTGTLFFNTAATLTGNFTVGNGILALNGNNQVTAGPLVFGTAGAANNTAMTFSQNSRSFANAISTQGTGGTNTLQSQGGGQNFNFAGGLTLGNNLTLSTFGGSDSITVQTGAIGGTGNLATNVTTISAGGGGGAAGTVGASGGTITLNSNINNVGTFTNNGNGTSAVTVNGVIGSNVTSVIQNSATSQLNISNNGNTYGGTSLLNGTIFSSIGGNASNTFGTGTFAFGASGAANTTLLSVSNAGKSYSNALTSTGSGGSNTIFTSGGGQTFTFSGATTLSSGANASTLVLSTGGTSGNNSNILSLTGGITGTGNVVTQSGDAGTTGAGAVAISGAALNFTGTLTNAGSATSSSGTNIGAVIGTNVTGVVQNSAGSPLSLSAANTYTGPTTVTAGLLTVTSTGSINGSASVLVGGTGALTLTNSASLSDAGTLNLVTGATLTLSAANGTTETIGNLILNGNVEPAGTYDTTTFSTLPGSSGINFASSFGETLTVAVPEPSTWLSGIFCMSALGWFFRRRAVGASKGRQAA